MNIAYGVSTADESDLAHGQVQTSQSGNAIAPLDFPEPETIPAIRAGLKLPTILGNGALIKFTSDGGDVAKVLDFFSGLVRQSPDDAASLLDLALLHLIQQRKDEAYRLQARALQHQRLFRVVGTLGKEVPTRLRVLALVAPGDFMNNVQLEFLLDSSAIGLDLLYLTPGQPLPPLLPDHDVLFNAVNESDENAPILCRLARLLPHWPRPVLNDPSTLRHLTRNGVASLFARDPHVCAPGTNRVTSTDLRRLAQGHVTLDSILPGATFPVLVRPVGSHCGKNLDKIDRAQDLIPYLDALDPADDQFFLAQFLDYRAPDGLYRKYRVVLIDRVPWLCHLGISDHWKIHYVNADMDKSAAKRDEEARAMATFDHDFARRHHAGFASLCDRIGLDYFGIDCAELPDGRLLLFEAETAMVIHAMDSPALYPYKVPQMARVFTAFQGFLSRASIRSPGLPAR